MTIACVRCGRVDDTLRVAYYRWVVSVVFLSFRRVAGGVLCARCRRITNLSCSALTALAGWWGLPWGLIWTPKALFSNLRGGERVAASANAVLLAAISGQLRARGDGIAGAEAYNAAIILDADAARQAAAEPAGAAAAMLEAAPARTSRRADVGRALGTLLVLILVAGLVFSPKAASASSDLVLDSTPAVYAGNTVSVTGTIRNRSDRTATAVWVEVIVTDSATGREVARGRTPASAPTTTVPAHGTTPFYVDVTLPSTPDRIKIEKLLHWR